MPLEQAGWSSGGRRGLPFTVLGYTMSLCKFLTDGRSAAVSFSILLAFDVRVSVGNRASAAATVDVNVWPQPNDDVCQEVRERAARMIGCSSDSLRSPLDLTFLSCIPKEWLSNFPLIGKDIALVAFARAKTDIEREGGCTDISQYCDDLRCDISYADVANASWKSLGYDVCDGALSTSLLYTCDETILESCASKINEWGLFSCKNEAAEYSKLGSVLHPEHFDFSPVEVLLHKRSRLPCQ